MALRVTLYAAVSLDGRLAGPGGALDWLPAPDPDDDFGYAAFLAGVDALAMGRTTYDEVRGFGPWPYEGRPTLVFSHRPAEASPPPGVRFVAGSPAAALQAAVSDGALSADAHVWLVGGGRLTDAFRVDDRIDIVRLFVVPVVLGAGPPLWTDGPPSRFSFAGATPQRDGVVELVYTRR